MFGQFFIHVYSHLIFFFFLFHSFPLYLSLPFTHTGKLIRVGTAAAAAAAASF